MITLVLIAVISIISVIAMSNRNLYHQWLFNPWLIHEKKQWYRFVTHAFLHADYAHLIFNMLTLYFFGTLVEEVFAYTLGAKGPFIYIFFFLISAICASVPAYYKHKSNHYYSAVGASGAVSAILYASILFSPLSKIYLFFIPIGIPAVLFGVFYLIFSARMAKKGNDNIAHDTHFWGAIFGFIFPLAFNYKFILSFIYQILDALP